MVNNVEVIGLNVNDVQPSRNCSDASVSSRIEITFNSDLDTSTIVGNFVVLEDKGLFYTDDNSLNDLDKYNHTQGNLSYENKTITFVPREQLLENTRYIVSVRDSVKDILGRKMVKTFTSTFYTQSIATLPKVEITSPKFGIVSDSVPTIEWVPQNTSAYILQISKVKTFEVLSYEEIIRAGHTGKINTKVDISNLDFDDGLYYLRVKSVDGDWSNESQFFIKRAKNEQAVVSKEDIPEDIVFCEDYADDLVVVDYFPRENDVMVNEKVNIFYVKVLGEVSMEDIDFNETFAVGDLFDSEDEDLISPHGYMTGMWNVVYDSENHESYVIFVPDKL